MLVNQNKFERWQNFWDEAEWTNICGFESISDFFRFYSVMWVLYFFEVEWLIVTVVKHHSLAHATLEVRRRITTPERLNYLVNSLAALLSSNVVVSSKVHWDYKNQQNIYKKN